MKFRLVIVLILVSSACVWAKPAKPGLLRLRQPDGSSVRAYIRGDEYGNVLISADGHALMRDADGYYSYAWYDANGIKHSSFRHYGEQAPKQVMDASAHIPYELLFKKALNLRGQRGADAAAMLRTKSVSGSKVSAVVILAQFSDLKFKYSEKSFEGLLSKAKTYFNDQFGGKLEFEFVVTPVIPLPESYAYYGKNGEDGTDSKAAEAIYAACMKADAYVDFSRFDNDGDGCVDNIFMFYAGPDEAEGAGDDYIWSHSWDIESAGMHLTLDGVRIKKYALTSELIYYSDGSTEFNGIGSFCHEFSHLLGLQDLYDTDDVKSGGTTEGVWGYTSLMDKGAYNNTCQTPPNYNALEREMLGIASGIPLREGMCTLMPVNERNEFFRMDTDNKDEYFLFEFRKASGWDQFIGGNGLLVYHIDKSDASAGYSEKYQREFSAKERWTYNEVNCRPDHMCAKIIPAAEPHFDVHSLENDISPIYYPGVNGRYSTFVPYESSFFSLTNISKTEDELSFLVVGSLYMDEPDVYQDAVILNWHLGSSWSTSPDARVVISAAGKTVRDIAVCPTIDNKYSCTVEGLEPATKYTLEISIALPDGVRASCSGQFTTGTVYEGAYPAISFGKTYRYISGAFKIGALLPLRLKNGIKSTSHIWRFNGSVIKVDPSTGYYELKESGILSVEYVRADGTRETVIKEVSVK